MGYTHIGLEDPSRAVSVLNLCLPMQPKPGTPGRGFARSVLQMRRIFCSAAGHRLTLAHRPI
jgi:hypothetical protein